MIESIVACGGIKVSIGVVINQSFCNYFTASLAN